MYNSKILAAVKEYGYYWAVTECWHYRKNYGTKAVELGRIYIDNSNINTLKKDCVILIGLDT